MRLTLIKWHIWLGWLADAPLLLWTVSGLFMVAQPVETVRGTHLHAETPVVSLPANPPVFPQIDSSIRSVDRIELTQRLTGAQWIIRYSDSDGGGASRLSGNRCLSRTPVHRRKRLRRSPRPPIAAGTAALAGFVLRAGLFLERGCSPPV